MSQQSLDADPVEAAAVELWLQTKNDSTDWSWDAVIDTRKDAYRRTAAAILSASGLWNGLASAKEHPSITCPRCGFTSYHPKDIAEGYCGQCHDWTGVPSAKET